MLFTKLKIRKFARIAFVSAKNLWQPGARGEDDISHIWLGKFSLNRIKRDKISLLCVPFVSD